MRLVWILLVCSILPVPRRKHICATVSNLPAYRHWQQHSIFGAFVHYCIPAQSVCFRTPRLLLGHPSSFTSVHNELKCMCTQTAPWFYAPHGKQGNRGQVSFKRIHRVVWLGVELTTLGL